MQRVWVVILVVAMGASLRICNAQTTSTTLDDLLFQITTSRSSQSGPQQTYSSGMKTHVGAFFSLGLWYPEEQAFRDIYSSIELVPGFGVTFSSSESKFLLKLGLEFIYDGSGTPYVYEAGMDVIDAECSCFIIHFVILPTMKFPSARDPESGPYIGAGIDFASFHESLDVTYMDPFWGEIYTEHASASEDGVGVRIVFGYEWRMKKGWLFLELAYSYVDIGNSFNVGGFTVTFGGRF